MTRKRDDTRRGKRWGETSGRRTDENEKEGRDGEETNRGDSKPTMANQDQPRRIETNDGVSRPTAAGKERRGQGGSMRRKDP